MPKKGNKTARRAGGKNVSNAPQEKDDGTRWEIVRNGTRVYGSTGITKKEAERLAAGLKEPAEIRQIDVVA